MISLNKVQTISAFYDDCASRWMANKSEFKARKKEFIEFCLSQGIRCKWLCQNNFDASFDYSFYGEFKFRIYPCPVGIATRIEIFEARSFGTKLELKDNLETASYSRNNDEYCFFWIDGTSDVRKLSSYFTEKDAQRIIKQFAMTEKKTS
jgi:hypothetical protein